MQDTAEPGPPRTDFQRAADALVADVAALLAEETVRFIQVDGTGEKILWAGTMKLRGYENDLETVLIRLFGCLVLYAFRDRDTRTVDIIFREIVPQSYKPRLGIRKVRPSVLRGLQDRQDRNPVLRQLSQ
jgi:hypothetical protein